MDIQELDEALDISSGSLTLASDTLTGLPLQDLLTAYNNGHALTVDNAAKQLKGNTVLVSGTATFMNVTGLPVHAVFSLDGQDSPKAAIRFTLLDPSSGLTSWSFGQSFPALPYFPNFTQSAASKDAQVLNELKLGRAYFILSTASGTESELGIPVASGLNFAAELLPSSLIGLFAPLLGQGPCLIYGRITMPRTGATVPPLPVMDKPWNEVGWTVPGIRLEASLDLSFTLGNLSAGKPVLHLYCPTDASWLAQNPTYAPDMAVSLELDIPSAGYKVDLIADFNAGEAALTGAFSGFKLDNLEQLSDLAQGQDLFGALPQDVQKLLKELGGLSLTGAGLGFHGGLSGSSVDWAYISVGMPNVKWNVFSGMDVESVTARFMVVQPFDGSARSVHVTLSGVLNIGGTNFEIFTEVPDFSVRALLEQPGTLPLGKLFQTYLPELPVPPDLHIDDMELFIQPGKSYSFSAGMADDPPWKFDLGSAGLAIRSARLTVDKQAGSPASGSLAGGLELLNGKVIVDAEYDLPGEFYVRAQLPDFKLSELIGMFDQLGLKLPTGFDLDLKQPYVLISRNTGELNFTAAVEVDDIGLLALTIQQQMGKTGAAVGIALDTGKLASVAGLRALQAIDDLVGLEKLMLVASSLESAGFNFPDMAHFQAPGLAGKNLKLPPQASGLAQGLNLYAQLNATKSKGLQALLNFLHISLTGTTEITLAVSLPDPGVNSKLFLSADYKINKLTTIDGELGLMLINNQPGAFLAAKVNTQLQGKPIEFDVVSSVLASGFMISGTMKGTISFPSIAAQLSNVAFVVGLDWAGIPSIGFDATLDVKGWDTSVAVFFDGNDPSHSMFAGAVSDISLGDAARELAGQHTLPAELTDVLNTIKLESIHAFELPAETAKALDGRDLAAVSSAFSQYGAAKLPSDSSSVLLVAGKPGSLWYLTDMTTMKHYRLSLQNGKIEVGLEPQVYCAPQDTLVGGLTFRQGAHLEAKFGFLMLHAQIRIVISSSEGIAADAAIDPIRIGDGQLFSVTSANGNGGPQLSLATFAQTGLDKPQDPKLQGPHFLVTGKVKLLGIDVSSVYLSIGSSELSFTISQQVSPIIHLDFKGTLNSSELEVGGGIVVGLKGDVDLGELGKVQFAEDINGSITVGYRNQAAYATFQGGFEFEGISCSIPPFKLDTSGLQHIADLLWAQVKDILNKLLADADRWLGWIESGVISVADHTAKEIGHILNEVYNMKPDEIAQKTKKTLGYGIDQVTQALQGAGASVNAAVQALTSAGYAASDIASAIKSVFTGIHVDTNFGHLDQSGPHVDTPTVHLDLPSTHVDTGKHADIGGDHIDKGSSWHHIDTGTPHADSNPHLDTGMKHQDTTTPHGDTTPHVDTGTHIDENT
ncbi:hypothetical protein AB6A23_13185 [Paenibacillus tarimensis]